MPAPPSGRLDIRTRQLQKTLFVTVDGDLDLESSADLLRVRAGVIEPEVVVLVLTLLRFVDSQGVRALRQTRARFGAHGAVVCTVPPMARQPRLVLELAEEWADHREDALASLGAAA